MTRTCYFLFLLLFFVAGSSCKKGTNLSTEKTFVKLFPSDTSYQPGGAFQLADGSFVIYGFTPEDNGRSPLLIITDVNGNIKKPVRLPGDFHYCTIKPAVMGTKMIAVGVERDLSSSVHICEMNMDGEILSLKEYPIPYSIKSGPLLPPNFLMNDNAQDLIISGTVALNKDLWPFILSVSSGVAGSVKAFPNLAGNKVMARDISGNLNEFAITGSTITGKLAEVVKIEAFCLRLNSLYQTLSLNILSYPDSSISSKGLIANSSSGTILYGSKSSISNFPNSGFSDLIGTLYSRKIDASGIAVQEEYRNYENLAHPGEMSETSDGFIMAATTNELLDFHVGSDYQIYLLKLDKNLKEQWHRKFNKLNVFTVVSVMEISSDGGYLISGYEHTSPLLYTMCLIKTDREGNIVTEQSVE